MRPIFFAVWFTTLTFTLLATFFTQIYASVLSNKTPAPASQKQTQAPSLYDQIYSQLLYSPFGAITRAYTADSPTDFWERATSLGSTVRVYAEDLLHRAAPNPAIAKEIAYFEAATQGVVASAGRFQAEVRNAAQAHGVSLEEVSDELARSFMAILEDLKAEFPPHEAAPSHEERLAMTASVMTKAEGYAVSIGRKYGMSDASVKAHFGNLRTHIEPLIIITGDLVEQHPVLLETLLFSASIMLIPEAWLLRPLLSLFGFGPYGPVKGSLAAWTQRRFWGAAVAEGSWFAHLQSAGMKLGSPWRKIGLGIGAGLGMVGSFRGCGR